MVNLSFRQIDRMMINWFKALKITNYICVHKGSIVADKKIFKIAANSASTNKHAERYRLYFATRDNKSYVFVMVESTQGVVDKNHYPMCEYLATLSRGFMLSTDKNKYIDNIKEYLDENHKNNNKESYKKSIDVNAEYESYSALDKLVQEFEVKSIGAEIDDKELLTILCTSYSLPEQLPAYITSLFATQHVVIDLPRIYPMLGSEELYGMTYDYDVLPYEDAYNNKEYSIIYDDDVMVRLLLAKHGELIRCKRVLFDGSPYVEYMIKIVCVRSVDDS